MIERLPLDRWVARLFDRIAVNPIRWALGAIAVGIFVPGIIYSLVERNVSMPDGWWWAFISLTTVGYGDFSPKTPEVRLLAVVVISSGVLAVAIITSAIAGRVTERRIVEGHELTPELNDDVFALAAEFRERADLLERIGHNLKEREEQGQWVGNWEWPSPSSR